MQKRQKAAKKQKIATIRPPGLHQVLLAEAERFIAKRGQRIPETLLRRLPILIGFVRDPSLLLVRHGSEMRESRSVFAKAYARNPEIFLELMLHLYRFHEHLTPIRRALRDHRVITFQDQGRRITKPINKASAHELVAFIRTQYGAKVDHRAVSRDRERLAMSDAKQTFDPVMEEALGYFAEFISREVSDADLASLTPKVAKSKMTKEK